MQHSSQHTDWTFEGQVGVRGGPAGEVLNEAFIPLFEVVSVMVDFQIGIALQQTLLKVVLMRSRPQMSSQHVHTITAAQFGLP